MDEVLPVVAVRPLGDVVLVVGFRGGVPEALARAAAFDTELTRWPPASRGPARGPARGDRAVTGDTMCLRTRVPKEPVELLEPELEDLLEVLPRIALARLPLPPPRVVGFFLWMQHLTPLRNCPQPSAQLEVTLLLQD